MSRWLLVVFASAMAWAQQDRIPAACATSLKGEAEFFQPPKTTKTYGWGLSTGDWAAPSDIVYSDGVKYKILIGNGVAVLAALFEEKHQFRVSLAVLNCGPDSVTVFPQSVGLGEFAPAKLTLAPVPASEIQASIRHRSMWALFFAGMASATPQQATVYDNYGKQVGTVDVPNQSNGQQVADIQRATANRSAAIESGTFKTNTLAQFQFAAGDLYFKRDKHWQILGLALGIGDKQYAIDFRKDGKDFIEPVPTRELPSAPQP